MQNVCVQIHPVTITDRISLEKSPYYRRIISPPIIIQSDFWIISPTAEGVGVALGCAGELEVPVNVITVSRRCLAVLIG